MSQRSWFEHADARAELLAEADWLPVEVAEQLVVNAEAALEDILDQPDAWPLVPYWHESPRLRRRKITPFRINVIYYVSHSQVRVIAYAHERREPGYWRHRLSD